MTITVRRQTANTFEVMNGHHRLKVCLALQGKATVIDAETGEHFDVHEVDGQIVVLQRPGEAAAEAIADAAIGRAARAART